jgi:hypothetical protein
MKYQYISYLPGQTKSTQTILILGFSFHYIEILTPYITAPRRELMSRTTLLRSGGSTDLKTNNTFSLDKVCEMKAVKTETKIIKLYSCDWKEILVRQWGSRFRKPQHRTKHVFPWKKINIRNTFLNIPSPSLTALLYSHITEVTYG